MLKQGSALDRYFKISERGSNFSREIRGGFATFFAMSYIVVLNPADPLRRRLQRRNPGLSGRRRRHRLRGRHPDHPHGRLGQAPVRHGHRAGRQRLRRRHGGHEPGPDLAGHDGPGGALRRHHADPGPHRVPDRGVQGRSGRAQDGHRGGHRPVHRPDRAGQRRLCPPHPGCRRHHGPGGPGLRRQAPGLAHPGVRVRPDPDHRPGGPQGQGRHPDRHRGLHRAVRDPGIHPAHRPQLRTANLQPAGLVPGGPDLLRVGRARTCP